MRRVYLYTADGGEATRAEDVRVLTDSERVLVLMEGPEGGEGAEGGEREDWSWRAGGMVGSLSPCLHPCASVRPPPPLRPVWEVKAR